MKIGSLILLLALVAGCAEISALNGGQITATSFETDADLTHVKGEDFTLDESRSQFGSTSLKWSGSLEFLNLRALSPEESGAQYGSHFALSPTFVMSIYNEAAVKDNLRVEFNGTAHFDLNLNFAGWRTVWVPFNEMEGEIAELKSMRLVAPSSAGSLWVDDIVFSQYVDDRHPYPGFEVPFIKQGGLHAWDHWVPEIPAYEKLSSINATPISAAEQADLERVNSRLRAMYEKKVSHPVGAARFREKMTFDLPLKTDKQVSPIRYLKPETNDLREFGKWMLKLAQECLSTGDAESQELFAGGVRYYFDQGWGAGSSQGTIHHIGYSTRELQTAFFLMKDMLREKGLLDAVGDAVRWQLNFGEMLDESQLESNLDYYNTQSVFRMMSALLADDPAMQATCLEIYSDHLTKVLALTNSQGFRPDGTAWHHWGHYPAYATGAFDRVPVSLKALAGTSFRIGEAGHANFKRAFMAATIYSNHKYWGIGLSGRHPLGGNIEKLKEACLALALSGTPDGKQSIDPDVASAYVRLWGNPPDTIFQGLEKQKGGGSASFPNGHWTFPYAALSVHRRGDWSVNIKGYNRYVWASELYGLDNRYGRYQSNGTVQILPNISQKKAGYVEDGWDWNHPPGATTVVLPFEELEPEQPVVMFKSEETFAGGCTLDGNGVWAMKLNEGDGFTIDPGAVNMSFPNKLKARKSVFCFGEQLLCLGSGIEAVGSEPVHTTLFQNGITETKGAVRREGDWLIDPIGNGYKIIDGAEAVITVGEQTSPNNKYSMRQGKGKKGTKPDAKGLFAKAWIDHGAAPKNASYAYIVVPSLDPSHTLPRLEIVRKDNRAHVVEFSNTTAYACFEAGDLNERLLESVSEPCYVMIQGGDTLKVAVSNPDLQQLTEAVKRHASHPSPIVLTTLRLKGQWKIKGVAEAWTEADGNSTLLTVKCKDGASMEVELEESNDQALFEAAKALSWKPVFSGKSSKDWNVDGEFAMVVDVSDGLEFSAGPEEWNHAHHSVLWSKETFAGDLKIEYDYTRLDDEHKWVNILYVMATGKGGEFTKDVMDWADYRKDPWMKNYFETMKLLHISYAAYSRDDNGVEDDYVRCRRYPKADDGEFSKTEIKPDSFRTGLFQLGNTVRITAIKKGDRLFFNVADDGKEKLFAWQSPLIGEVTEGRVGLRHMWMKSARYKNFTVSGLAK